MRGCKIVTGCIISGMTAEEASRRYPVRRGEVWTVGPHVFRCDDLEAPGAVARTRALVEQAGGAAIGYCNPPWGAGAATGARKLAGVPHRVDWVGGFLPVLCGALSVVRGSVFIEGGRREEVTTRHAIETRGFVLRQRWPAKYYGKHPCVLWRWVAQGHADDGFDRQLGGFDTQETPARALSWYRRPLTVLDPCVGQGLTATAAVQCGHRCIGVDVHAGYLAVAIARVAEATGMEARRRLLR